MIKDSMQIFGTDDYEKIQTMYEEWSYGIHRKKKNGNRLIDEYEEDVQKNAEK